MTAADQQLYDSVKAYLPVVAKLSADEKRLLYAYCLHIGLASILSDQSYKKAASHLSDSSDWIGGAEQAFTYELVPLILLSFSGPLTESYLDTIRAEMKADGWDATVSQGDLESKISFARAMMMMGAYVQNLFT